MKSPYRRPHASLVTRIVACGMCALLALTSVQVRLLAEQRGGASRGHSKSDKPPKVHGLRFVTPTYGHTELNQDVNVALEVGKHEDLQSLVLKLNGRDVTKRLRTRECRGKTCTVTGIFRTKDGLRTGSNLLTASVSNSDRTAGTVDRTMFSYFGLEGATGGVTIDYYTPKSVGFSLTTSNTQNLLTLTTGNGRNVVDMVASLPVLPGSNNNTSVPYPDVADGLGVQCFGPVYQGAVLDRSNPTVVLAAECANDIPTVEQFLSSSLGRALNDNDLVLLMTAPSQGAAAGLDTSGFGGTNYAALPAGSPLYPTGYMMIGLKGAAAGTAHEVYAVSGTTDTVNNYPQALTGTLMADGNSHYNFVPDGDAEFQTVSGTSPRIMIGPSTFSPPGSTSNAFWLVVLDRQTLQPINYTSGTSSTACQAVSGAQSCGSVFDVRADGGAALATTLSGISPRNLIFLTTVGCPFAAAGDASAQLGDALQSLGGMRYAVNALSSATPSTCAYSLVSVNDGNHQSMTSKAAVSANQFAAQGQLGAMHGFLARDNSGLYDVAGKDLMIAEVPSPAVDYTFQRIASATRNGWSLAYDADLWVAYNDISFQLLTDPSINETGSHLYDVRYFYTDVVTANAIASLIDVRLAPSATNPVRQTFSANTTTPDRFALARATLTTELQQVKSATGYLTGPDGKSGLRGILDDSGGNMLAQAFSVASAIGDDLASAGAQTVSANGSDFMNLAAGVTTLAAVVGSTIEPEAAVFFGVMSGALWTGSAAMTPLGVTTNQLPGPESPYDVLLSDLVGNASDYGNRLLAGFDGTVDNVLTDGSKLAQVAALTSNSDSGWSLHDLTSTDSLVTSFADGARRSLWMDVLPNLYGVRVALGERNNDPASYGSKVYNRQAVICSSVYTANNSGTYPPASGTVPAAAMLQAHHVGDGLATTWDVYFLAEGQQVVYPGNENNTYGVQDPPISAQLAKLLTTSDQVIFGTGEDARTEIGLNIAPMMLLTAPPFMLSGVARFTNLYCDATVSETEDPGDESGHGNGPKHHPPTGPKDPNGPWAPRGPQGPRDRGGWHVPPRDPQPPAPRGGGSPLW